MRGEHNKHVMHAYYFIYVWYTTAAIGINIFILYLLKLVYSCEVKIAGMSRCMHAVLASRMALRGTLLMKSAWIKVQGCAH